MSKVKTGRLLREMIDLTSITYYPDPAYKCVQFSSYDRRSVAPDAPGSTGAAITRPKHKRKEALLIIGTLLRELWLRQL